LAFEKLNLPLVPLRRSHGIERAEIAMSAGRGIYFPRVKAVFARF